MSTAQQVMPLPHVEPEIFHALTVELGYVPPVAATVRAVVPPVFSVPAAGAEVAMAGSDWSEPEESVPGFAEPEWSESAWSGSEWAQPEESEPSWSATEWAPSDHPAADQDAVDEPETFSEGPAVQRAAPAQPVAEHPPVAASPGIPARQVPDMPPISRA